MTSVIFRDLNINQRHRALVAVDKYVESILVRKPGIRNGVIYSNYSERDLYIYHTNAGSIIVRTTCP